MSLPMWDEIEYTFKINMELVMMILIIVELLLNIGWNIHQSNG